MDDGNAKTFKSKREQICEMGFEDAVVFESPDFDEAIIGVSEDGRVVYDYDIMVEQLSRQDNMSTEEAIEFIEYNTIRSLAYIENPPIIIYKFLEA